MLGSSSPPLYWPPRAGAAALEKLAGDVDEAAVVQGEAVVHVGLDLVAVSFAGGARQAVDLDSPGAVLEDDG